MVGCSCSTPAVSAVAGYMKYLQTGYSNFLDDLASQIGCLCGSWVGMDDCIVQILCCMLHWMSQLMQMVKGGNWDAAVIHAYKVIVHRFFSLRFAMWMSNSCWLNRT